MGFFSNIFKRKKGGTFFGNLVRGVTSTATGGILGSGSGLAKWQAGEEQREYSQVLAENQALIKQSQSYKSGAEAGLPYANKVNNFLETSPQAKQLQNQQVKAWFTRNWWIVALPLLAVIGVVIFITKRK